MASDDGDDPGMDGAAATKAPPPAQEGCDPVWGCVSADQFADDTPGTAARGDGDSASMRSCQELRWKLQNAENQLQDAEKDYATAVRLETSVGVAAQRVTVVRGLVLTLEDQIRATC